MADKRVAEMQQLRESGHSLTEIGSRFGLSGERARQILRRNLRLKNLTNPSDLGIRSQNALRRLLGRDGCAPNDIANFTRNELTSLGLPKNGIEEIEALLQNNELEFKE